MNAYSLTSFTGTGKLAQQLRAPDVLAEDQSSVFIFIPLRFVTFRTLVYLLPTIKLTKLTN